MNRIALLLLMSLGTSVMMTAQSVGVGTTTPDSSAILDISSTTQGLLIPRMTAVDRDAIDDPADGLLVFVTTDSMFYLFDGTNWVTLTDRIRDLRDADGDTRVMVELTPDEDVIHFDMEGVEYFRMDNGRLKVLNTGKSVFFGNGAGASDDLSNNSNVAIGDSALFSNTTGNLNTANGRAALSSNTIGNENTATGAEALRLNTTGSENTATGRAALLANTTGNKNTATGAYALGNNTTGIQNTANGTYALRNNTTGSYNMAIGNSALFSNTTGTNNTATGNSALFYNTTGSNNTANGIGALVYNTTGKENTANGAYSLVKNTT